jgi:hypothetical protein
MFTFEDFLTLLLSIVCESRASDDVTVEQAEITLLVLLLLVFSCSFVNLLASLDRAVDWLALIMVLRRLDDLMEVTDTVSVSDSAAEPPPHVDEDEAEPFLFADPRLPLLLALRRLLLSTFVLSVNEDEAATVSMLILS